MMTAALSASASVLAVNPLDAHSLLGSVGTFGLFAVIFAETGLLIGFFLPGDSLLFTAGILCTTRPDQALHLSLPTVLIAAATGALLGAEAGYWLGRRAGPILLSGNRPRVRAGFERAQQALDRYGYPKAIFLARFIPVVRTVLNPLAGAVNVPVRTFTLWQIVGGLIWSMGITLAGYGLGSRIPSIDRYLLPIVAVVVALSLLPILLEFRRERARARA
jgi:membrane-associated protein